MKHFFFFFLCLNVQKSPLYTDFKAFFYTGQYCVCPRQHPVAAIKVSPSKDNIMLIELP